MIVYLADLKSDLIETFRRDFAALPVKILEGSIFNITADALVSPANSMGIMDGGLDGQIRNFFGKQIEDRVRQKIAKEFDEELLVGQAFVVPTDHQQIPYLISAPTMRVPKAVPHSINAYLAFRAILRVAKANQLKSIVCPGLCSLSGQMSSKLVSRQMHVAYLYAFNNEFRFKHWRHERDFELYLTGEIDHIPMDNYD